MYERATNSYGEAKICSSNGRQSVRVETVDGEDIGYVTVRADGTVPVGVDFANETVRIFA